MGVPERVGDARHYYVVGQRLGGGSAGVVHAGQDEAGREVAIKFLHEHLSSDPRVVERFAREARLARRVRSEHVARVLAAGQNAGRVWIAYERLHGETLEERLRRFAVLSPIFVESVMVHVLDGLGAAHSAGIVHRDVKPANIFLRHFERGERAYLLDFGISKFEILPADAPSEAALTSTTETLGSSDYMAPEQIDNAATAGSSCDTYAAAIVAYRALSGELPFASPNPMTILYEKRFGRPRTLHESTGLPWPDALEAFFVRALARDPQHRHANAAVFREAFGTAIRGELPPVETLRAQFRRSHGDR